MLEEPINNDGWFDVETGANNAGFIPIDKKAKARYMKDVLAQWKFPYENESAPSTDDVCALIPSAYANFERTRQRIGWETDTVIIVKASDDTGIRLVFAVSCKGDGFKVILESEITSYDAYMIMSLDIRLLFWLLQGPQISAWSEADGGSHIIYERVGTGYKRGLFFCWNRFHT